MSANMSMEKLRNIGIIAHIDAGKTTLTERILYYTEKIHRMGEVHEGTATMDYLPEEQERGITIASACTSCEWQGHTINIIDTPGHVDFTIEVQRSLRVLDGAVGVFCAVGGVEPQSETVWQQSENFSVPKIAFINKVDRLGADFEQVLSAMQEQLHTKPLLLTLPLGQGDDFEALLDIVNLERLDYDEEDQGATIHRQPLSAAEQALVAPWREKLLESLGEVDDIFLEGYLAEKDFSPEEIYAAARRATLARALTPTFCGSALRNAGIQSVLDGINALLPAPTHVPTPVALDAQGQEHSIDPDPTAPLSALVFKILMDDGRKMAFMRIYAGTLQQGEQYYALLDADKNQADRVQRIYRLHADYREQMDSASAGDIVAVIGLRHASTGITYAAKEAPYQLESIQSYEPVITLAIEPRNADEGSTLDEALERYTLEDPTLKAHVDEGSGHRMLSGMGELHLDVILERMKREYNIAPRVGHPQVVCRESIATTAEAEAEFDRELGKEHHYGKVHVRLEPLPRGTGNSVRFDDSFPQDILEPQKTSEASKLLAPLNLSLPWLQAAKQGVEDALQSGPLQGYPLQDVGIVITQMGRKDGVSSVPGYHMAAGMALREAVAKASPLLLEPIMQVEINVPEAHLGPAMSLFNTCGGRVENLTHRGPMDSSGQKIIQGLAPLSKLFGFSTSLRSATQGRAGLILQFATFDTL